MTSELRFKGFHILYLISKVRREPGLNANHLHPSPTHPNYFKLFQELPHPCPNLQKTLLYPMDHPTPSSRTEGSPKSIQSYFDYEMGFLAGGVVAVVA